MGWMEMEGGGPSVRTAPNFQSQESTNSRHTRTPGAAVDGALVVVEVGERADLVLAVPEVVHHALAPVFDQVVEEGQGLCARGLWGGEGVGVWGGEGGAEPRTNKQASTGDDDDTHIT